MRPLEKNQTGVTATVAEPGGKNPEELSSSKKIMWRSFASQSVRLRWEMVTSSRRCAVDPLTSFQAAIAF